VTADRQVVAVPVVEGDQELVADRLFALGASAVSELTDGDGTTLLVADLPPDSLALLGRRHRVLERDPAWESNWRHDATVVRAGEHLVIRPDWVTGAVGPGDVEVVVAAADAFGSGSHATTRLCIARVEELVRPGDRVLDVGSGSGVLGVAALLLGAGSLTAVDVDPVAVAATRATATLNGVGDRTDASDRPLAMVTGEFELVLANLLVPIIEELGPDLRRLVAPGGRVVASGVLVDQVDRTVAALGGGPVDVVTEGDWAVVVVGRAPG
jgi:ribosomal protein L11 methyltransferase